MIFQARRFDFVRKEWVIRMKITKEMLIGDVLDQYPDLAEFFLEIGMHCLGCPHSRGESIEQACEVHGTDVDELLTKLNNALA